MKRYRIYIINDNISKIVKIFETNKLTRRFLKILLNVNRGERVLIYDDIEKYSIEIKNF